MNYFDVGNGLLVVRFSIIKDKDQANPIFLSFLKMKNGKTLTMKLFSTKIT